MPNPPTPRPAAALAAALFLALAAGLTGCGSAPAALQGAAQRALPLPPGIRVAFNHRGESRYRSPISGRWRQGDDLEALVLESIAAARQELVVAVQELSLPKVAEALVAAQRRGVRVRVVLENTYATPWSQQTPATLPPHQRRRVEQLQALGWGDAVAILQEGGVPLLDDTADGSRGSGLMH
ncbi:MAG: phospholipase, partial [Cyanobium sp.]